jgi:hypothetical protein
VTSFTQKRFKHAPPEGFERAGWNGDIPPEFTLSRLISIQARRLNLESAVGNMPELTAVRLLQEREGYSSCFGRDVALLPGPNGLCMVEGCCWRNFCTAYRSEAPPIDSLLGGWGANSEISAFVDYLSSSDSLPATRNGVSCTITSQAPLMSLSRKLIIGSPHSVICESAEQNNMLRPIQLSLDTQRVSRTGGSHYTMYYEVSRTIWWTANPTQIFDWHNSASPLLRDGTLDYLAHITTDSHVATVWKTSKPQIPQLSTPTFRQIDTPYQAFQDGEVYVSDPNFVPLLNLEIPYLESASLTDLHKLIEDNPEEFTSFRSYLFKAIEQIKDKRLSSETFGSDIRKIQFDVDDQLRKLKSDLRKARVKHYVEIAGGAAATFVLGLYCLTRHDSHTWAIIGPGGFLYVLSPKLADYFIGKMSLKESPVYFLWMLGPGQTL